MTEKTVRRIPKLYRAAGRVLQKVKEEGGSLKTLVYEARHPNIKALYALVLETLKHGQQLDYLVRKTQILVENPKLNPWVTRVLMTELLWQKKALNPVSPPLEVVQSYHEKLLSELANAPMDETVQDTSVSSNTVQSIRYVRVNTLKDTTENVVKWLTNVGWEEVSTHGNNNKDFIRRAQSLSSCQFMRDFHIPNLLVFPHDFRFYETDLFVEGTILLQDKASCTPAIMLNPPTNSVVLDMCAAPGMKTTQVAALIGNKGTVYAVEIHRRRYATLCQTVEISGATCVKTINSDVLGRSDLNDAEYIILDPPCSGSGMLSRKGIFREEGSKDPQRLTKLTNFQCSLLRHAMTNFPKVKRIVYSTCSVHPEENEAVVDSVLQDVPPNFVPIENPPHSAWMTRGSTDFKHGSCGFYAHPETHLTNGFFVAVFERSHHKYEPFVRSSEGVQDVSNSHCNEANDKKGKRQKDAPNSHCNEANDETKNELQEDAPNLYCNEANDKKKKKRQKDASNSLCNEANDKKKKKRQKRSQINGCANTEREVTETNTSNDALQKMLRAMHEISTPVESVENPQLKNGHDGLLKRKKKNNVKKHGKRMHSVSDDDLKRIPPKKRKHKKIKTHPSPAKTPKS